jgi:hypothetical protein
VQNRANSIGRDVQPANNRDQRPEVVQQPASVGGWSDGMTRTEYRGSSHIVNTVFVESGGTLDDEEHRACPVPLLSEGDWYYQKKSAPIERNSTAFQS